MPNKRNYNLVISLIYLIVAIMLLCIEAFVLQLNLQFTLCATFLVALVYVVYVVLSISFFEKIFKTRSALVTSFYMVNSVLRFLVGIILLVSNYFLFGSSSLLTFTINLFFFYMIALLGTNYFYLKCEKKMKAIK